MLDVPPSSVTVTVLTDGKVSLAISDAAMTAVQQQAALERLQRGLTDGVTDGFYVSLAGFTVAGANVTSSGILFLCIFSDNMDFACDTPIDATRKPPSAF